MGFFFDSIALLIRVAVFFLTKTRFRTENSIHRMESPDIARLSRKEFEKLVHDPMYRKNSTDKSLEGKTKR